MTMETSLQTALGLLWKLVYDTETYAIGTFATNFTSALTAPITDASPGPEQVANALRSDIFNMPGFYASAFNSYLGALGRIRGYSETDPRAIFFRYFEDVSATPTVTVKSRARVIATAAAGGSNVGNGVVARLSVDRFNQPIENGSDEAKSWTCVQDEHSGAARWSEIFTLRGTAPTRLVWPYPGAGSVVQGVKALSIADSARYVQNPGFETYDATNKFSGWFSSVDGATQANWTQDTARYYKDVLPGTTPAAAIQAAGTTDYLYQTWSAQAINWNPYVPLYAQVAYMRRGSATGTLVLQIGDQSVTVDISTKTNDEWNVLRFPAATPTTNAWFRQWNASNAGTSTNPFVKVGVTTLATGTCLIDDLIVAPYVPFDGLWTAIVPGPANSATTAGPSTPFLKDDVFTGTDSSGAVGKIQICLAKAAGVYLPSTTGGTQTWAEFA